ncbi:MBL fold metallo-hydrolase [Haloarculaceae archaeon H-GB1-1]|nr:MBL fold metallo-hydrolase [Haloarculaceae archaeon H-GB1-1]
MFTRLSVPTPFQVGPINAYLAGRTLVDPGPESEEAWAALLAGLEAEDLTPSDLERVVVTHPHPDHFGLAARLSDAGADVLASRPAADILADFEGRLDYEQAFFEDFFSRCGMAESTAETTTDLPRVFLRYAPDVQTDRVLDDGDEIQVEGGTLTAHAAQGHAPGELLFSAEDDGEQVAIVGDQVLPDYTPNPFLQPPPEVGADRPHVVPAYNRSLERLREADFDRFLPGHGDPIDDPAGRVSEIRDAHEQRTGEVAGLLDGPTTPVEVMEGLFGDLPVTEYFSGISEAVGHLDVLLERDRATVTERGGLLLYELST